VAYLDLLRSNQTFRRLWFAQLISLGGDWFNVVALTGLLLRLTGSSFYGGAVLATGLLPQFLLSPLAGVVADRFDRRRLMLGADLVAAVAALSMLAVRTRGSVWLGLVALGCIAACGAFFDPASRSGLPNVVEADQLDAANVLMSSAWGIMVAVGAAAGGTPRSSPTPGPSWSRRPSLPASTAASGRSTAMAVGRTEPGSGRCGTCGRARRGPAATGAWWPCWLRRSGLDSAPA